MNIQRKMTLSGKKIMICLSDTNFDAELMYGA